MIETRPAPESHLRSATASYAHLVPAERPAEEPESAERTTFWDRPARVAKVTALDLAYPDLEYPDLTELDRTDSEPSHLHLAELEAAATWWPVVLVVLLATLAGLALFGVL